MKKQLRWLLVVVCLFSATIAESVGPEGAGMKPISTPAAVRGYRLSKGAGLTVAIAAGTAFCKGSPTNYGGGRLEMVANATNYVYVDPSAGCAPAASTKGFSADGAPIATVLTGPSSITDIAMASAPLSGGGLSPAGAPATGTGITSLNNLTASSQTFATGTSGTNFNISSSGSTHTFNLPNASATARGLVNTGAQTFAGAKTFSTPISPASGGTGANNSATAGLYLRGNGTNFVTSSVAAGGAGTCAANQFVTGANDNAAPTCAQPAFSNLSGSATPAQLPSASTTAQGILQLGGDLGGTSAAQTVISLQGNPLASTAPAANQVLAWSGTAWTPATPTGAGTGSCASNQYVTAVNAGGAPTCAQPGFSNLSGTAAASQLPAATSTSQGAIQLGSDITGTAASPVVDGLQGRPVAAAAPTPNQVLTWNGSSWAPGNGGTVTSVGLAAPAEFSVSGSPVTTSGTLTFTKVNQNVNSFYAGPSSGSAAAPAFRSIVAGDLPGATATAQGAVQLAKDLTGSATAPKVAGLQGNPVAATAPTANQVLAWSGTAWTPTTPAGGAGTGSCASNQYVTAVNAGAPTCAQPGFSNLSGTAAASQLPAATSTSQGAIQLGSDISGTAASPVVDGLQGRPVASTAPTANQVLTWNGSAWAPATPSGGGGSGWPSTWTTNSTSNAVTAQPTSGQDAVPLSLAPNVASPTADLFDVYKDQGLTTKVLWIGANGNLNFMGNDLSLGTSGQSMPSFMQVYGGGGNQPYVQLQTSDGTKNAYLSLSNSTAGVACISSSAPASDCAAGTQIPLLAQDLGGSATAPKVVGLQGNPVSTAAPASNQVLTWNGSAWAPATPSGGSGNSNYVIVGHQGNTAWGSSNYFPLIGLDYVGAESFVQAPMPAGTATAIYFDTGGVAPGTGNSAKLTLRDNGVSTALSCTVAGSATSCNITGQSVAIAAGDLVDLLLTTSGTGPTSRLNWSIRIQGQ